jgi:hypothetical protein
VIKRIVGKAAIGDSALRAIELGDFQTIIEEYLPHAGTLDSSALIHLAIALDGADRRDEAYKLLAEHQAMNSDVMGTLAGRLKRNWLLSGRRLADAEAAEAHYAKGYELAKNERGRARLGRLSKLRERGQRYLEDRFDLPECANDRS